MSNLNVKTLKIVAICIASLIALLMIMLLSRSPKAPEVVEIENVDAMNNRERIIYHSGDMYCYTTVPTNDVLQYMLIRMPIDFNDNSNREIIENFGGPITDTTLDVYKNKLFYKKGATYMYDIVENRIDKFCDGEIQFMLEPNFFVMLEKGNLFKGRYYENTLQVNKFEKLAEGNFIRVGEDSKRMYYYAEAGSSDTIIVGLDKETLNIIIFDHLDTGKQKLDNVFVTDSYLFVLYGDSNEKQIKKISKVMNKDGAYESELLKIDKFNKIEFVEDKYSRPLDSNTVFDDIYFYGMVTIDPGDYYTSPTYDSKLYKYDSKTNKVSEYTGSLNERFKAQYSMTSGDDACTLYYQGEEITKVPTKLSDLSDATKMEILEIDIIEDYIYYEVKIAKSTGVSDIIFARVKRGGGESQRINITKK